jgi:glycosyltransferase involved in cell wall biosynthesis
MMKRVAMLLNGPIQNDYRVIKIIDTLSQHHSVHLFYINGNPEKDQQLFNEHVSLTARMHEATKWVKFIRHTWFCYEFSFFERWIKESGQDFDFIWANDLPTLLPAYNISRKLKCTLIYDSHEIYTETINQFFPRHSTGLKKYIFQSMISFMRKHGAAVEHRIFPKIDVFITVNESLLNYFKERNNVKRGLVIMNLPKEVPSKAQDRIDLREKYDWTQSTVILMYQGQLNEGRGLSILFESVKLLPSEYKLVVVGNGSLGKELSDWTIHNNMTKRIKFVDTVPLNTLSTYTSGADLGINLLETFNLSKEYASPNKLFEYIHASIPIVASDTIENQRVFSKYPIGKLTKNHPEEIAAAIIEVARKEKSSFEDALHQAKSHYHWENQVELLNSVLDE